MRGGKHKAWGSIQLSPGADQPQKDGADQSLGSTRISADEPPIVRCGSASLESIRLSPGADQPRISKDRCGSALYRRVSVRIGLRSRCGSALYWHGSALSIPRSLLDRPDIPRSSQYRPNVSPQPIVRSRIDEDSCGALLDRRGAARICLGSVLDRRGSAWVLTKATAEFCIMCTDARGGCYADARATRRMSRTTMVLLDGVALYFIVVLLGKVRGNHGKVPSYDTQSYYLTVLLVTSPLANPIPSPQDHFKARRNLYKMVRGGMYRVRVSDKL